MAARKNAYILCVVEYIMAAEGGGIVAKAFGQRDIGPMAQG